MKPKIIFSLIAILGISFGIFLFFKSSQQDNIAYGFVDIDTSSLTFLRSGQISDIYVQSGQEVKKGTILAKLNSDDLLIQKRQQIATCQALQASLQEMQTGYTQEQIDKSCYNYKALSNSYELATITLKRLEKLYKAKQISNFIKLYTLPGLLYPPPPPPHHHHHRHDAPPPHHRHRH